VGQSGCSTMAPPLTFAGSVAVATSLPLHLDQPGDAAALSALLRSACRHNSHDYGATVPLATCRVGPDRRGD